jgi:AAA domain
MSFQFKPAIREQVGLLIGLAGGTGSGKTFSAMRLASGISGGKPFAVIDTEAGRAKHYADQFKFDHGDLSPPFTPEAYALAILAADEAKYPCIVVDSCTHEWAGEGGVLEMHEAELDRMAGQDWEKRERVKMAAWIKPKTQHKKMVQRLLQVRAHLILCFRAEEKVDMVRDDKTGKMLIVPKKSVTGLDGWIPVCEKNLPYELTASFLLTADAPGIPKPIKLQEQHRIMFPDGKPIGEASGKLVAAWADGGTSHAPLTETELDNLCMTMDVASMPALETAFGLAYTKAKKIPDQRAMKKLKAVYDGQKEALRSTAP